jgi:hypothetical protein
METLEEKLRIKWRKEEKCRRVGKRSEVHGEVKG